MTSSIVTMAVASGSDFVRGYYTHIDGLIIV